MALLDSVLPKPASTHRHNDHHDKRRSFGSSTLSDSTTPTIPSPSPSHTREKSLDDLVLENVPVFDYYALPNNSTIPRAPGGAVLARSPMGSPSRTGAAKGRSGASGHKSQLSITQLHQSNEQLQKALEFEENETMRLEKLLKDVRHRADSSQFEQNRLEQDVVQRDEQIALLQKQLKEMKRSKHELENTLTNEQMTYINEKAAWLDKENEYETKLGKLKAVTNHEEVTKDNASIYSTTSANSSALNIKEGPPKAPPPPSLEHTKMIDRLRNEVELTRQQLELVSKEYALRHEQVKHELEQVKQVNSRLQEENEGFQVLLAQKTVLGEFSLADELDRFGFEEDQEAEESGDSDGGDISEDGDINGKETEANTNEDMKRMKSRIYELEFEKKSLQNHNRALKISLERLVQRLLEFREFESVVEDSNQDVTQRSISLFHRRVSSSHPNQSTQHSSRHGSILDIPRRRPPPRDNLEPPQYSNGQTIIAGSASSTASGGGSPRSATSSVFQFPRAHNRVVKPASTWSSMIFVNNRSSQNALPDNGLESPLSTTSSGNTTYGDVVSSGASSIINMAEDGDIKSVLNNSEPRRPPITPGQKKLRPLKLQSTSFEAAEAPLQSATSSSSWGFGMY